MDISAFGAFFLFLYPFWPAIVAACFAALRRNRQEGFFLISVVIGYVAFVIAFIVMVLLSRWAENVVDMFLNNVIASKLYVFLPVWLPIVSNVVVLICKMSIEIKTRN